MSNVRVNLLPDDVRKKGESNRANGIIAGSFVLLLVLIAGAWWVLQQRVDDARVELATEDETLTALRADLAELSEFQELQARAQSTDQDVATILGNEVSLAGLFQDVAAVMPTDVELQDLSVTVDVTTEPTLGDERPPIGLVAMTGRTLQGHAPGVERLLLELDKLAELDDLFMTNSTLEENDLVSGDVAAFTVEADLGQEALTGRYRGGIPEELR